MIIVGIRSDLAHRAAGAEIAVSGGARSVSDVIGFWPPLRSGISRGPVSYTHLDVYKRQAVAYDCAGVYLETDF